MSEVELQPPPAWQTEELQDEWIEPDDEDEDDNDNHDLTYGSISFTAPLPTHIHTPAHTESNEANATPPNISNHVGTFLVREDVQNAPLLPKTPGRRPKGIIKDFFSPLPLERMFEPPSPPASRLAQISPGAVGPSRMSQQPISPTDAQDVANQHLAPSNAAHGQFTFSAPRANSSDFNRMSERTYPQAESTPIPPPNTSRIAPPSTDPRLRLFQFQYDTYTRDHLSAIVDSIAVNTPSGADSTPSPSALAQNFGRSSRLFGGRPSSSSTTHLRSAKRVKLSPQSDFYGEGAGAGASITRPRLTGKDYVGESRSLMQQIKQARDFSTISTVATAKETPSREIPAEDVDVDHRKLTADLNATDRAGFLSIPEQSNNPSATGTLASRSSYSSASYREQAAALMAQIKDDMKGQKRLFSGETDMSFVTSHTHQEEKTKSLGRSSIADTISIHTTSYSQEEKENQRQTTAQRRSPVSRLYVPERIRQRNQRRASGLATDSVDRELAGEVSRLALKDDRSNVEEPVLPTGPTPTASQESRPSATLAPPSYPSSSIRAGTNEDLNRFVSSSTASGTTVTTASVPSFVKHAGPAQIRTIAPGDIPTLPERLGNMMYDKVKMRWVRSPTAASGDEMDAYVPTEEASEDPFGDIESLRDDSRGRDISLTRDEMEAAEESEVSAEMSRAEERTEIEELHDEEEAELTSFSTDASGQMMDDMAVAAMNADNIDGDVTTDSDDEDQDGPAIALVEFAATGFDSFDASHIESEDEDQPTYHGSQATQSNQLPATALPPVTVIPDTPIRPSQGSADATPVIRSALKSTSATPSSVLKDPSRNRYQTPLQKKGHRRSVSFSDGKREGPIQGLSTSTTTNGTEANESDHASETAAKSGEGFVPSARSKRIAAMMGDLEDSDNDSPSKTSSVGRPEEIQPLSARRPTQPPNLPSGSKTQGSRRIFSRSHAQRPSTDGADDMKANATFLTECSFGVAHDRVVEAITDVQPFEPYWEELHSIDLSNKKLESVARLKEFLPRLDALCLNSNQLSWLSGVPGTVRTLSVASNSLTGLTSYNHLLNLENVDISRNDVDSLCQFSCLRHLRELKADGNKITSLDGLQRMDGLVKLSVQGNRIQSVDLSQYRWSRLEMLNISHNRLERVYGLGSLPSLIALNLDNNQLGEFSLDGTLPRLRILRVSGNRLRQLNVAPMPNLRTLYADNNSLPNLVKVDRLTKLENLSLRNQSGRGFNLLTRDVRDVKRLYLSGNPLMTGFLEEPCYNLVYLELAACRLTSLPEDLSRLVPNLRVLNLNYNFLEDARPLEGLTRLRKLTIIGSRLKGTKPLIRVLQRMPDVEMLDFRMNPCTLGWYLPLLVKDVPGALQPSEEGDEDSHKGGDKAANQAWRELDAKFRRDLPNESYIGRLAYRGLVMHACPEIRMLDGVEVSVKEKEKAQHLLTGILSKRKKSSSKGG